MTLKGFDVYGGTGSLNFTTAASDGYAFGIAKATEGATYQDPSFPTNYKGIKAAGLIAGSYNFARPKTSTAQAEVDAYCDYVNANGGFSQAIPGILDLEDTETGFTPAQMQAWALEWAKEYKRYDSRKPILYSYPSFIESYGLNSADIQAAFDLWIASYETTPDTAGFKSYQFQQTSSTGSEQGKTIDVDAFNGTLAELQALCGIAGTNAPTPAPKPASEAPAAANTPTFGEVAAYQIKAGDILSMIANKYNVPVSVLQRYNNITDVNSIQVGGWVRIPGSVRVTAGQTLSSIVGEANVDFVATVNNINPNRIYVGQTIFI